MSNAPAIVFRNAQYQDLALLRHWDQQPHVMAASDDDWEWEKELKRQPRWREQLIAELDGRPIGFLQIIDPALEESKYWGEVDDNLRALDIWIGEESDLGKGYGTIMMHWAIDRCFENPKVKAILVDPLATNTRAQKFYRKIGFNILKNEILDIDGCTIFQLKREKWFMKLAQSNTTRRNNDER